MPYAPANDLNMYFEIHGEGPPLLLLLRHLEIEQADVVGYSMGGAAGLQLAVLPGTTHFIPPGSGLLDRSDWLLAMIPPFLDPPPPAG